MPKNKYKVHAEQLSAADNFKILILEVPTNELEDKLAYLAKEKGIVTRSMYEDWLIATCVANINQLLYSINRRLEDAPDLMVIRGELIDAILKYNKKLNPDSLVINSNHVIKFKNTGDLDDDEMILSENIHWNKSYYDDLTEEKLEKSNTKIKVTKDNKELKNIDDLVYTTTQKWWSRIGQYVKIKTYSAGDAESILAKRFFHNRTSFVTFVVSICVENFDELFEQLDSMGVPGRIAPPILMHELYDICENVNSFLTFENAQELVGEDIEDDEEQPQRHGRPAAQDGSMKSYAKDKNVSKRKFKDVPKKDLLMLGENMKVFLIGQDNAVEGLVNSIQRASIGLKDPNKPIGSFLFAGRTGVGKCVKEGSLIFSEDGIKPIENFCNGKLIEKLEVDVFGINGVNKTSHIYKEGIKPGRDITTDSGYELGGSLIHPVVVMDENGNMVFKKFNELTTDDYVAIQYRQDYFSSSDKQLNFDFVEKPYGHNTIKYKVPNKMNTDLAYYIGLLIGDGSLATDGRIGFTNIDKQLVSTFFNLSERLFGITPKLSTDAYGYYFSSRYIYDFLKYGCEVDMVKSTHKLIPSSILESSKECIIAFIQGLMDTDGYFEENSGCVGITLATKKLISQLQIVLLNFGIISSVRHKLVKYNGDFNSVWELKISSKFAKIFFTKIGFRLNRKQDKFNLIYRRKYNPNKDVIPNIHRAIKELISGYTLNRKFHKNYRGYYKGYRKPSRKKLNDILRDVVDIVGKEVEANGVFIYLSKLVDEDIFWSRIANIEEVQDMSLYDFTVPETHTFISNGFISHNTLATKVLADELIKGRDNMITIDCSEFSADHEYAKLIGAPAGYIGHESGGMLTNAIAKNPFSVVVFDEVEKASYKVHELLLQILEEGRLTDGKGKTVSFKDAVLILTSNVGVKEVENIKHTVGFGNVAQVTEAKKEGALDSALKKKFKPEFLNRIDAIVHFNTLTKKDYMRIIDIELYKLNDNLKTNATEYSSTTLRFDEKIKKLIYKAGITSEYGARPLKREIEKLVATPLAKKLLEENITVDSIINISANRGKAMFGVEEKLDEPPFYISEDYPNRVDRVNTAGEV